MAPEIAVTPERQSTEDLGAPLYVAWQITNECNLACLHCIEESGPGKAFKDELNTGEAYAVIDQLVRSEVPYVSFSGGEPMVRPDFFGMVERITQGGVGLKIETNGHYLTPENCRRFKQLGVKAVQVSLDGATPASFNKMRVHGRLETALDGVKNLREAGVPIEINFVPAKFNIKEIAAAVDLAHDIGAYSFYTGKLMFTGNAVRTWGITAPDEADYPAFFDALRAKTEEYKGRMRVYFHEMGLLEELRYRLENPAALFIILPNGKVKLINALPFTCGDLRQDTLSRVWQKFQLAWKSPRVSTFVDRLAEDPTIVSRLHQLEEAA
ncbi:MAG: radical SAM protein [Elusimicrobia bacterium]|nr:radical SAM protein [Elusimicrobiota bacterium]